MKQLGLLLIHIPDPSLQNIPHYDRWSSYHWFSVYIGGMYYPVNVRNIWILEQVLETYYSVTVCMGK